MISFSCNLHQHCGQACAGRDLIRTDTSSAWLVGTGVILVLTHSLWHGQLTRNCRLHDVPAGMQVLSIGLLGSTHLGHESLRCSCWQRHRGLCACRLLHISEIRCLAAQQACCLLPSHIITAVVALSTANGQGLPPSLPLHSHCAHSACHSRCSGSALCCLCLCHSPAHIRP